MAISRMQQPRQNYGLGSFVKKVTGKVTKPFTKVAKKLVPKEIAGIMRAAAPFLPPGYREAAYLLGTAKQTGRISPIDLALTALPYANKALGSQKSLPLMERKGFFAEKLPGANKFLFGSPEQTLGGTLKNQVTQDATTGIFGSGGKMFQFGGEQGVMDQITAFKDQTKLGDLLLGGKDGGFSKSKIAGLGVGVLSLIQSAKTPEEAGNLLVSQTGNSDDYQRGYDMFSRLSTDAFKIPDQFVLKQNAAGGGLMRTNYAMGSDDEPKPLPNDPTEPVNPFRPKPIGPFPSKMAEIPKDLGLEKAKEMFIQFNGREPVDMQELLEFFNVKQQAADGGLMRENFALGTRPTAQESGLGGLPIEADMRYTGGFMPYGAVEKADDVPARLSKNEFVFTADAVRAAGGGSVQKGAKKMYDTMKQLEQQPEAKGAMA